MHDSESNSDSVNLVTRALIFDIYISRSKPSCFKKDTLVVLISGSFYFRCLPLFSRGPITAQEILKFSRAQVFCRACAVRNKGSGYESDVQSKRVRMRIRPDIIPAQINFQ